MRVIRIGVLFAVATSLGVWIGSCRYTFVVRTGQVYITQSGGIIEAQRAPNVGWGATMLPEGTFLAASHEFQWCRVSLSAGKIALPGWAVTGVFAVLLALCFVRRQPPSGCKNCGYDLRASPNRCPECGMVSGQAKQLTPATALIVPVLLSACVLGIGFAVVSLAPVSLRPLELLLLGMIVLLGPIGMFRCIFPAFDVGSFNGALTKYAIAIGCLVGIYSVLVFVRQLRVCSCRHLCDWITIWLLVGVLHAWLSYLPV